MIGTALGCLMSDLMMEKITTEKMAILKAIQGSNVWSGQALADHSVRPSIMLGLFDLKKSPPREKADIFIGTCNRPGWFGHKALRHRETISNGSTWLPHWPSSVSPVVPPASLVPEIEDQLFVHEHSDHCR